MEKFDSLLKLLEKIGVKIPFSALIPITAIFFLFIITKFFLNPKNLTIIRNPYFIICLIVILVMWMIKYILSKFKKLPADKIVIAVAEFTPTAGDSKDTAKKVTYEIKKLLQTKKNQGIPIELINISAEIKEEQTEQQTIKKIKSTFRGKAHFVLWGYCAKYGSDIEITPTMTRTSEFTKIYSNTDKNLASVITNSEQIQLFKENINNMANNITFICGLSFYSLSKYEKSLKFFKDIEKTEKEKNELYFYIANCSYYLKQYDKDLKAFEEAIRLNPDDAMAWSNKGVALAKMQKHGEALKAYEEAVRLNPDLAQAWYNKGNALAEMQKHGEALKAYEEAVRLNPDYAQAWYNKGNALAKMQKHGEALKAFEEAVRLNPDYAMAWSNKGVALADMQKHGEAIKAYEEAIRLNPDYAQAWYNKGNVLAKMQKHGEALKAYDEAVRLNPDYAMAWYNKSCCYAFLNNKQKSLKNLKKAINLDQKYKKTAKESDDFKSLRDDQNFRKLTE
ncbi:tetratricopeptide repeat protein [bacterium]|nr:tetratricopeptide repeat protein [bacterium]